MDGTQNYWLARGGRRLLCAPEHLRTAHHEVSEGLRINVAMREVKKLIEEDPENYEDWEEDESPLRPQHRLQDDAVEMEVEHDEGGQTPLAVRRAKRMS